MKRFEGKVAVITGGESGIGAAIAVLLNQSGAMVVSADIRVPQGPLDPDPRGAIVRARLDVRDESSVQQLFQNVVGAWGHIDYLVNCAGIGIFKPVTELTSQDWEDVLATNLKGAFYCCREAVRLMEAGGRIVNIGSVAGVTPLAGNGVYGVSKSGLRMLSGIINQESWERNVRSTYIALGAVSTAIWQGRDEFNTKDMLSTENVAGAIADILATPLTVRIDEISLAPSKGIL